MMKMAMIIYNEAIDEEIMSVFESCCIDSFTKWQKVLGKGKSSGAHLNSGVWPGANNVCMAVIEDNKVAAILNQVENLRKTLGKEGIKAFVLPVEDLT